MIQVQTRSSTGHISLACCRASNAALRKDQRKRSGPRPPAGGRKNWRPECSRNCHRGQQGEIRWPGSEPLCGSQAGVAETRHNLDVGSGLSFWMFNEKTLEEIRKEKEDKSEPPGQ